MIKRYIKKTEKTLENAKVHSQPVSRSRIDCSNAGEVNGRSTALQHQEWQRRQQQKPTGESQSSKNAPYCPLYKDRLSAWKQN